jgi:hypothetical protein
MATRKDRKSKTAPLRKQKESKVASEFAFPSDQERLPLHIPRTYQVAMGTREEIEAWFRDIPQNSHTILIPFSTEEEYRAYGPIFWYVAKKLPEIVARNHRRRLERLVNALTELLQARPRSASAPLSGAGASPAKGALPSTGG